MSLIVPVSFNGNFTASHTPIFGITTGLYSLSSSFIYSDNSQVVVGTFDKVDGVYSDFIAKLDPFGYLDVTNTQTQINFITPDGIWDITQFTVYNFSGISFDELIIVGDLSIAGVSNLYIARLDKNLKLLTSPYQFPVTMDNTARSVDCNGQNGGILICGEFTTPKSKAAIYQLGNTNAITLSASFTPPTISGDIYKGKFLDNINVIIAGTCNTTTPRRGIMKLNPNGTVNTGFNANIVGTAITNYIVYDFDFVDKSYKMNSDIIVGGYFTISSAFKTLVRIDSTGAIIPSWNTNILSVVVAVFYEDDPNRINNGKILCSTYDNRIYLLDGTTGIIDTTFNNNKGYIGYDTGFVKKIQPLKDDTYALYGSFRTLGGGDNTTDCYARINYNGIFI